MNKVILIGNLTRDPDFKQSGDLTIVKFTIAAQRKSKNKEGNYESDFISCTSFGKTAEFISKYFTKGMKMALTGRIQTGSYTNKDGNKVYTTEVVVEDAEFVEKKGEKTEVKEEKNDGFMNIPDGAAEELPFN